MHLYKQHLCMHRSSKTETFQPFSVLRVWRSAPYLCQVSQVVSYSVRFNDGSSVRFRGISTAALDDLVGLLKCHEIIESQKNLKKSMSNFFWWPNNVRVLGICRPGTAMALTRLIRLTESYHLPSFIFLLLQSKCNSSVSFIISSVFSHQWTRSPHQVKV